MIHQNVHLRVSPMWIYCQQEKESYYHLFSPLTSLAHVDHPKLAAWTVDPGWLSLVLASHLSSCQPFSLTPTRQPVEMDTLLGVLPNSPPAPFLRHEDITVAWICALPVEMAAAEARAGHVWMGREGTSPPTHAPCPAVFK